MIDEPPVLSDAHFVGYVFENEPSGTSVILVSQHFIRLPLYPAFIHGPVVCLHLIGGKVAGDCCSLLCTDHLHATLQWIRCVAKMFNF